MSDLVKDLVYVFLFRLICDTVANEVFCSSRSRKLLPNVLRRFRMTAATGPINLLRGWPCPSLVPVDHLRRAAKNVLSSSSIYEDALMYGPDVRIFKHHAV